MSSRLNPYVNFDGTAQAALEFYRDVFGGELSLMTFGQFGDASAPGADKIMHGQLETPSGFTLMASDVPPGMEYRSGSSITISLSGDDEELRDWWAKLSDGATVGTPLQKQMWGDEFGDLVDRFGVGWLINIAGTPTG